MSADGSDLIESPERWPYRPYLPLKRMKDDGSFPDNSILIEGEGLRVFKCGILVAVDLPTKTVRLFPCSDYEDVDALLADGWQVD